MKKKGLAILGSTGSIGRNALELVRAHPDRFRVISLSAGRNVELLKRQIDEFNPLFVSVATEDARAKLDTGVPVKAGIEAAMEAASYDGVDIALSAISGAAGLLPTLSAIRAGKDIALANKETLVMA
ncbi:MAG: 1-deoxy-D-xylulose-5-phosphate reductoisomerase, partial [Deltaproteobacteria bacterium]|nr:1-deoxy-D-xylulose-5-phosphate reductoisomerase [Deltaproteobacteria bacterium]